VQVWAVDSRPLPLDNPRGERKDYNAGSLAREEFDAGSDTMYSEVIAILNSPLDDMAPWAF
jgi:hypothetical protein